MALKMLLRDNWIHGDLHAGNILCPADPGDERVFVLDAGHLTFATPRQSAASASCFSIFMGHFNTRKW